MAKIEEFIQLPIPGEDGWQKGVGGGWPGYHSGGGGGGFSGSQFIPTFGSGVAPGYDGPAPGIAFSGGQRRRRLPAGASEGAFGGGEQGGIPPELLEALVALLSGGGGGQPGQMPRLMARGGIVTRPTNAIIGEAGPEAVIPLGGRMAQPQGFGGGMGPFGRQAGPAAGFNPFGGGSSPGGMWRNAQQGVQQQGAAPAGGPLSMEAGPLGPMGALIQNAMRGGSGDYGGIFGTNPSAGAMAGMRQRMVQDAGAQERAARLGLQARGDADPSTYGFQALQSQLQGQGQVAQGMNQADLAMRQQQHDRYWQMLQQLLAGQLGVDQTERQGRWSAAAQPGVLGGALQGLGGLAAGAIGAGGILNRPRTGG